VAAASNRLFTLPEDDRLNAQMREWIEVPVGRLSDVRDIFGLVLLCYLAGYRDKRAVNHVLLEGVNGSGKTSLVIEFNDLVIGPELAAFYQLTGWDSFVRTAGSVDLTPGDVVGYDVIAVDPATGRQRMTYRQGPIFRPSLVVYNDENNRSPPKTMACWLEPMAEGGKVTISTLDEDYRGVRERVIEDFFLIGSQNPPVQEGTFPLPEALYDRFMVLITMPYTRDLKGLIHRGEPSRPKLQNPAEHLRHLLTSERTLQTWERVGVPQAHRAQRPRVVGLIDSIQKQLRTPEAIAAASELEAWLLTTRRAYWQHFRQQVRRIEFPESTAGWIERIVFDTWSRAAYAAAVGGCRPEEVPMPIEDDARPIADAVRNVVQGASPRAAIALRDLSLALCWAMGEQVVTPRHVRAIARPVLRHRISLGFQASMSGQTADDVIDRILDYRGHAI
jgi:MoxR-like ATPase